ncbi:MAG: PIN domain-containing protein [Candidatus Rokubacteria bacterium]|nr:PIN domain-containing protein [Candidatus Rokubacteria bacterium]
MPTSRKPERLVVDANPILAALLGGQARRVFFEAGLQEFAVPEPVIDEVSRYVPSLARKLGVDVALVQYALELLPLRRYPAGAYARALGEARRRLAERDPDDVAPLALALQLGIPLWSNDRDFEGTRIERFTSAQLLALFFPPSTR